MYVQKEENLLEIRFSIEECKNIFLDFLEVLCYNVLSWEKNVLFYMFIIIFDLILYSFVQL